MVITQIIGGLGNQMFQYAAGRALAVTKETEVKLDTSGFDEKQLRNFDLFNLNINAAVATKEEINKLKAFNTVQRVGAYLTPYPNKKFYKQTYFHFDKKFFKLGRNIYLRGHFHSEKFFEPIKDLIKHELTIKNVLIENVKKLGAQIQSENSVSIHIRRGDYINVAALKYHGILNVDYYKKAIALIQQQQPEAIFYIFSDDEQWVTENLSLPRATLVSGNLTKTHFEDLYLMTQCRHNIIANSSFSWWGAWLGTHQQKTVLAPKNWFNEGPKDTYDLTPEKWLRI